MKYNIIKKCDYCNEESSINPVTGNCKPCDLVLDELEEGLRELEDYENE